MRILTTVISLTLAVLVVFTVDRSASFAADTTRPREWCWWDGTAPFCDGSCGTARLIGAYEDADDARSRLEAITPGGRNDNSWRTFGKACVTGKKALCCSTACPNGYTMVGDLCKKVSTKTRRLELPVPEDPAKQRKKGPIVAPGPVQETKPNKGPIAAPGPVEETELNKGPIAKPEAPYATKRKTGPITE